MIPAETAAKLAKILPRLGSEHDGEIINTVRAISRTLAAAGLDWHALAAAVKASASGPRPFDLSTFADVMAEAAQETAAHDAARRAPDAPARTWGRKLWEDRMEPWSTVAQHALMLDWTLPKSQGGRILTKGERDRLKDWERSCRLTNAEADWLSGIIDRLHAAVERTNPHRRKTR
ncbi:hypothetical protein MKK70_09960 [Methylobacterium sp. E-041]|uniref:hypothetical protein n=1 Tax=Methylobacterium sp. E-041 TaxID=2836573 RepID=UPI001FB87509|nr:hypothetical protein [Methylobacterium sp. E-041]MCJ2105691.1 hypothetical protein [Methylobacterium sp. E-041]